MFFSELNQLLPSLFCKKGGLTAIIAYDFLQSRRVFVNKLSLAKGSGLLFSVFRSLH